MVDISKLPIWIVIFAIIILIILFAIALKTGREVSFFGIKIGNKIELKNYESAQKTEHSPNTPIRGIDKFLNEVIHNEVIRSQTLDLINELKNLKTTKSPLFQDAISIDFSEFLSEVRNWTRSCVKIQGSHNDNFVINLYRNAEHTVFSTCIMDYFEAWKDDFGNKLLEAHKNNDNCKTIRVFIFHKKEDETEETLALIKKQKEYNITPMILLDEENEFDDFTIIDNGEVVGITNEMKFGKRLTTWYFEEENQTRKYERIKDVILNRASKI